MYTTSKNIIMVFEFFKFFEREGVGARVKTGC